MSKEEIKEKPDGTLEQGDFKMKKKPKKLASKKKEEPTKVDLSDKKESIPQVDLTKTEKDANTESSTVGVSNEEPTKSIQEVEIPESEVQQTKEKVTKEEVENPIQELTSEEVKSTEKITKEIQEEVKENPQLQLPENVEKLVSFMRETGGNLEDYVRLNADYSSINEDSLLSEYYKNTRPHLEPEEVKFLMEDKFSYDEDMDEERDIKRKQLAYKEEIAKARNFLEETKKKYYDEIKLRPGVTQDQQKATEFFNRYNKEQQIVEKQHNQFKTNTKDYFSKDFKGFDFNVGEKKFRYTVNNPDEVADQQSNLTNFVKKFLDDKGNVTDYKGYHKAIYAAKNADTIANHFYEQGKADAVKDITSKSKNIGNEPRVTGSGDIFLNGMKVKAINGVDSSKLKIKKRKTT
jgi:hypothetical protein